MQYALMILPRTPPGSGTPIAADSANANGGSSNDSPTTVANEHPLFNADTFGDDDEEILSLTNLPDNVDLNDLSVELDDSYLVF